MSAIKKAVNIDIDFIEMDENLNIRAILALILKDKEINKDNYSKKLNKIEMKILNALIKKIESSNALFMDLSDNDILDFDVIEYIFNNILNTKYFQKLEVLSKKELVTKIFNYNENNFLLYVSEKEIIRRRIQEELNKKIINEIDMKEKKKILFDNISVYYIYKAYNYMINPNLEIYINSSENTIKLVAEYVLGFKQYNGNLDVKFDLILSIADKINRIETFNTFNGKTINIKNSVNVVNEKIELLNERGIAVFAADRITLSSISNREFRKRIVDNNLVEKIVIANEKNANDIIKIEATKLYQKRHEIEDTEDMEVGYVFDLEEMDQILILNKNKNTEDILFEKYNIDIENEIINVKLEKKEKISKEQIIDNLYSLNPDIYVNKLNIKQGEKLENVLVDLFRGYQISKSEFEKIKVDFIDNTTYKLLEIGKINEDGEINERLSLIKPSRIEKNLDRYLLKTGDIVITARGDKIKVALIELKVENEKIIANGSMNVIRLDESKVNPKYIKMFLDSKNGKETLERIKIGRTIASVNTGDLRKIEIPCESLEVQNKIVEIRDEIFNDMIHLKNRYRELIETI